MDPKVKDYLATVTTGLKDDAELRLDVQAELASHLDDKVEELRRGGASDDDARAQAVAALGEVAEVAAGLERGNRLRLNQRAWLRRALRFALVPAAVIVAILCSDLQWAATIRMVDRLGDGGSPGATWLDRLATRTRLKQPEAALLKATPRERWESDRGNRVYYGEYVTHDVATKMEAGTSHDQQERLMGILETARSLDADNARYDYLRAALLLRGACEIKVESGTKGPDGQRGLGTLSWEVKDRARVDQAMADLLSGLGKPEFHRYGKEMLTLKLEAMGRADRLEQRIQRIAISAGALLPDLAKLRELARAAYLYGDLLAKEGRVEEARPYLDAWKTLTVQLNADSWTLIDCLVVTALPNSIAAHSALAYERLNLAAEASRTRREAAALGGPGKAWRERRNDPAVKEAEAAHARELRLYGSVLTTLLLPALNEWPAREDYTASRRLEYAVAMQAGLSVLSALLLLAMLACLVISLRWRFMSGGEVIPILLLPDGPKTVRILGYGVLLPLAVFAGVVLWVPISGQCYSVHAGMHKVLAEFLLLAIAILLVPTWLAVREARRRCRDLGIPCGRSNAALGLTPLLLCALVLAAAWWVPVRPGGPSEAGVTIAALTVVALVVTALTAALFLLLANQRHGLYCGTVARSLIPVFAAAVILLGVIGRPWLLRAEKTYIAADRILMTAPGEVGFSRIENDITARLQKAVADAAAGLEKH